MKSKLFTFDIRDILNGVFIAFLAALLTGIILTNSLNQLFRKEPA